MKTIGGGGIHCAAVDGFAALRMPAYPLRVLPPSILIAHGTIKITTPFGVVIFMAAVRNLQCSSKVNSPCAKVYLIRYNKFRKLKRKFLDSVESPAFLCKRGKPGDQAANGSKVYLVFPGCTQLPLVIRTAVAAVKPCADLLRPLPEPPGQGGAVIPGRFRGSL